MHARLHAWSRRRRPEPSTPRRRGVRVVKQPDVQTRTAIATTLRSPHRRAITARLRARRDAPPRTQVVCLPVRAGLRDPLASSPRRSPARRPLGSNARPLGQNRRGPRAAAPACPRRTHSVPAPHSRWAASPPAPPPCSGPLRRAHRPRGLLVLTPLETPHPARSLPSPRPAPDPTTRGRPPRAESGPWPARPIRVTAGSPRTPGAADGTARPRPRCASECSRG